jgi:hypothetical protein
MTYTLDIPSSEIGRVAQELQRKIELVRSDVQLAMAEAFEDTVLNNFGPVGEDRPFDWPPLSPAYAKKVGRTFATLYVTGSMKQAVKIDSQMESADVVLADADCAYATPHHALRVASPGLPTRRVFPIDEANEVTPYTFRKVVDAAADALGRMLR